MNLERGDILQMEPISCRGTLKLLPIGKKNKQKLLIGDDSGTLSCYEFRKGEPQIVFQTKVFDGPVSCVALGGNSQKKDKVFLSHSQRIVGLTKKGKEFFKLTSSLTETIQNIAVEDTRIWTGCEFIYNLYDNGKDTAYYISKDRINNVVVAHVTRENDYDAVLACQDNCIRIIHGSQLFVEIPISSPVTAVAILEMEKGVSTTKTSVGLVYGTDVGSFGLVQVIPPGDFQLVWTVDDPKRCSITCLVVFDLNRNGQDEIVIGREDGRVEVYVQDSPSTAPYKAFSKDIGESIRSLECGVVNTPEFNEIIVAAYSGKIISFTTEPVHVRAVDDNYGRSVQTVNNENRIKHMKKELEDLKKKLEKERDRVKKVVASNAAASSNLVKPITAPEFTLISKFVLDTELAAYMLTIELQTPIDLIILRSPVVLDLVETDTGTSVLSVTPPHLQPVFPGEESLGKFVAVFRCQSQEKRIILTLRTNEGEYGDLLVTIVACSTPKAAKIVKYNLKPLSLNSKQHQLTEEEMGRARNRVKYTGNVQLGVIHEWISAIFPDVPPRLEETSVEQKYFFRNTFTGATTICDLRKNELVIESENASTIAIVKENITRLANYRRVAVEEILSTQENSIPTFLSLIRTKLEHQLSLTRKMLLVDAIQEITMQENGDTPWLSEEYVDVLNNQESIRQEYKNRDKSLEYLSGIVTDLYVDWNKLQGIDAKNKIPKLQHVILNGTFDDIINAFLAPSSAGSGGLRR